jgi:hypothetical protein
MRSDSLNISVLYVRQDSLYKSYNVDCWDLERNAFNYAGSNVIIAHPPCRAFSKLKAFSKHPPVEKEYAYRCVDLIRLNGGILEHPRHSSLWHEKGLPKPGLKDSFGGFTVCINQSWFGHKAEKNTFLYICGIDINQLPLFPLSFDAITHVVSSSKKRPGKKELSKADRERTPVKLIEWLIDTAILIEEGKKCV